MQVVPIQRKIALLAAAAACVAVSVFMLSYNVLVTASMADEPTATHSPTLPPLVVDTRAPLLLGKPTDKGIVKERPFLRINRACYVCHDNYKNEPLGVMHAKEKIGCVDCHGESLEHQDDEDNLTPPEIMYPPEKIGALCRECHETHDAPAREVLKRWSERCPEQTDFDKVACTDCHGYHRLKNRIVRWDKVTGDVIVALPDKQTEQ